MIMLSFTINKGWLDCFVSLRYLYAKNGMGGDLEHLESTLTEKLPWLLSVINNGNPNSDCLLCQLSSLSRKDRKVLSMELKNSWTLIESIRESFRILVEDFMNSNSARIRLGTFTKYSRYIVKCIFDTIMISSVYSGRSKSPMKYWNTSRSPPLLRREMPLRTWRILQQLI